MQCPRGLYPFPPGRPAHLTAPPPPRTLTAPSVRSRTPSVPIPVSLPVIHVPTLMRRAICCTYRESPMDLSQTETMWWLLPMRGSLAFRTRPYVRVLRFSYVTWNRSEYWRNYGVDRALLKEICTYKSPVPLVTSMQGHFGGLLNICG